MNSKEADAVQYRHWEWPLRMITILRPSGYTHHPRGRQQHAAQHEAMHALHAPQRQRHGCDRASYLACRDRHRSARAPARGCARAADGASRGLKLFDIKCAWFNEEEYCEFFPRTLLVNV